jgi:HK97 family phage portal protein
MGVRGGTTSATIVGGGMSRIGNALRMFRATTSAVPDGALRPSMTMWYDPGGVLPPVTWTPGSGIFETHWDWQYWSALQIPGVWRARNLISQLIGGMPIGAWRDRQPVEPLPTILREPNPDEDRYNTIAAWVCDLLDHGNAIGVITAWNAEGQPVSVQPVRASETSIGRDPDSGTVWYRVNETTAWPASRMFHAKGTSLPGDLRGIGVLEAGLGTLTRIRDTDAYAGNAFRTGMPSGLLRIKDPDLQLGTDDDGPDQVTAKGIKQSWKASVATGDVAVLSDLVDFTPLSWTPSDAQMVEARQLSLTDIAALYGLDPFWLGAPSAPMVYQNVQDAAVQLLRTSLGGWIVPLEAQFSRMLPRGQRARFARDVILRDDVTTQIDNYQKLQQMGVVDVDEIRAALNMPPRAVQPAPALAPVADLFPEGDQNVNEAVNQ